MKTALAILILLVTTVTLAQQTRPSPAPVEDYSGMYSFLQEGEFVQITQEDRGRITGFVSRFGDLPSDKGAFLDQFIKNGTLDGHKLAFTTESVHGVWFEFSGVVGRGQGKTTADEGYYELSGTLRQYTIDQEKKTSSRSREVVFKLFPQDDEPTPAKRD